jgi:4-hydroxy 2-oxovalerate aldolase
MNSIKILDCTLRDGGYVNNWNFGFQNILSIISKLTLAKIDIIELGFITKNILIDENLSKFPSFFSLNKFKEFKLKNSFFVCMINYGEFLLEDIPAASETIIEGIRLAFHKKDFIQACNYAKQLKIKGYKVFIQPMVTANYSSEEFIHLLNLVNEINPYAFYIVDSFGFMDENSLLNVFQITDKILNKHLSIGFHSHNNLQLSYSNAKYFLSYHTQRNLIVDASLYGIGRGAGNLNIELLINLLNDKFSKDYNLQPILDAIDRNIVPIFLKFPWGYSLPYYLSAKANTHPNYSTFLEDLNTLTVNDISIILNLISIDKRTNFDQIYIMDLYKKYQSSNSSSLTPEFLLDNLFRNKIILLLAPGRSLVDESEKISDFIKFNNPIVISVNFITSNFKVNYSFFSNKRRYFSSSLDKNNQLILTSNILSNNSNDINVSYEELLNNISSVEDNAGLMLIKLLIKYYPKTIYLAGFDGYDTNIFNLKFTYNPNFSGIQSIDRRKQINFGMNYFLNECNKKINITFLTNQYYLSISPSINKN